MPKEEYIEILMQSLQKKEQILDLISKANREQKMLLADETLGPDAFEKTVDQKAELIEQLSQLDDGFEQIYQKVKPELEQNMQHYEKQIHQMQDMITRIVDKTMTVQTEEARNKQLIETKFSSVKQQIREIKSSQKAVHTYYNNMMKVSYVDAQFLDSKK